MATPRQQLSASSEARRRTPCKPNMQRAQRPAVGSLANPACSELRGPPSQTRRPQETPFFFTPPCRGRPGKSGRPVRTKSAPDPCTAAACRHGGGFTTAGLAAGTAAGTSAFTPCLSCFAAGLPAGTSSAYTPCSSCFAAVLPAGSSCFAAVLPAG